MLIGVSEGQGWRYEVMEHPDAYLVRMRDLDTGAIEEGDTKLFRTAAVAFAYAELSAAFDRYAAAHVAGGGRGRARAWACRSAGALRGPERAARR